MRKLLFNLISLIFVSFLMLFSIYGAELDVDIYGKKWHPGHYTIIGNDGVSKINQVGTAEYNMIRDPMIKGHGVSMDWSQIDSDVRGEYDWTFLDNVVEIATENEKGILLRVYERQFSPLGSQEVVDGAVRYGSRFPQYIKDELCVFQKVRPDRNNIDPDNDIVYAGLQFGFWLPRCNELYMDALVDIGKRYEDNPYFLGFFFSESSLSVQGRYNSTGGVVDEAYKDQYEVLSREFPNFVFVQGMNHVGRAISEEEFPNSPTPSVSKLNRRLSDMTNFGIGGVGFPDLCPEREDEFTVYKVLKNRSSEILVSPETQNDGCKLSKAELRDMIPERADFAVNTLGANIIKWTGGYSDRYDDLMQAIEDYPTITDCPTNYQHGCISPEEFAQALGNGGNDDPCANGGCDSGGDNGGSNDDSSNTNYQICHKLNSNSKVDFRYARPRHPVSRNLLFKAECDSQKVKLRIDAPRTDTVVYNKGYIYKNNNWEQIDLAGDSFSGEWLRNTVTAVVDNVDTSQEGYLLAFMCHWVDDAWICGCQDRNCAAPKWNLQAFQR